MKRLLARLVVNLGIFALPVLAVAQVTVPPQTPGTVPVPYNPAFIFGPAGEITASGLIIGIIEIALAIVGLISVLFVIIGGFRYVTSGGNEEQTEAAKKTLTNAIIGIIIVILAFVVVRVIANALILGSFGT